MRNALLAASWPRGGIFAALVAGAVMALTTPTSAQFAGDDITRACKPDLQRFCPKAKPGSDAEIECLDENFEKLGKACVTAIEGDPATAAAGDNRDQGGDQTKTPPPPPRQTAAPRQDERANDRRDMAEPPRDRSGDRDRNQNARSYYDRQDPRSVTGGGEMRAPDQPPPGPSERVERDRPDRRDDRRAARDDGPPPRGGGQPTMRDCRQDLDRYCQGLRGRDRGACIRSNVQRFSPACQQALNQRRQMHGEYRRACRQDLRRFCASAGRGVEKIDCLIRQEGAISQVCADAVAQLPMAERRRRLMSRNAGGQPRR